MKREKKATFKPNFKHRDRLTGGSHLPNLFIVMVSCSFALYNRDVNEHWARSVGFFTKRAAELAQEQTQGML